MKRKELIRRLTDAGCILVRPGARHDLYMNPKTGKKQANPETPRDRREFCKTYFEDPDQLNPADALIRPADFGSERSLLSTHSIRNHQRPGLYGDEHN